MADVSFSKSYKTSWLSQFGLYRYESTGSKKQRNRSATIGIYGIIAMFGIVIFVLFLFISNTINIEKPKRIIIIESTNNSKNINDTKYSSSSASSPSITTSVFIPEQIDVNTYYDKDLYNTTPMNFNYVNETENNDLVEHEKNCNNNYTNISDVSSHQKSTSLELKSKLKKQITRQLHPPSLLQLKNHRVTPIQNNYNLLNDRQYIENVYDRPRPFQFLLNGPIPSPFQLKNYSSTGGNINNIQDILNQFDYNHPTKLETNTYTENKMNNNTMDTTDGITAASSILNGKTVRIEGTYRHRKDKSINNNQHVTGLDESYQKYNSIYNKPSQLLPPLASHIPINKSPVQGYVTGLDESYQNYNSLYNQPSQLLPPLSSHVSINKLPGQGTNNQQQIIGDPLHSYKPQSLSDINLLATNKFRFAPSQITTTNNRPNGMVNYFEKQMYHPSIEINPYQQNSGNLYHQIIMTNNNRLKQQQEQQQQQQLYNKFSSNENKPVLIKQQKPFSLMLDVYPMNDDDQQQQQQNQIRKPHQYHNQNLQTTTYLRPPSTNVNAINNLQHSPETFTYFNKIKFPQIQQHRYPSEQQHYYNNMYFRNYHNNRRYPAVNQHQQQPSDAHISTAENIPSQITVHLNLFPKNKPKIARYINNNKRNIDIDNNNNENENANHNDDNNNNTKNHNNDNNNNNHYYSSSGYSRILTNHDILFNNITGVNYLNETQSKLNTINTIIPSTTSPINNNNNNNNNISNNYQLQKYNNNILNINQESAIINNINNMNNDRNNNNNNLSQNHQFKYYEQPENIENIDNFHINLERLQTQISGEKLYDPSIDNNNSNKYDAVNKSLNDQITNGVIHDDNVDEQIPTIIPIEPRNNYFTYSPDITHHSIESELITLNDHNKYIDNIQEKLNIDNVSNKHHHLIKFTENDTKRIFVNNIEN